VLSSFKELIVWQKAYDLVLKTYTATERFPRSELYGLTSQVRRCSVSIVSNIAEGYQRQHTAEYVQFLSIAFGSCAELETQLMLSRDLGLLSSDQFEKLEALLTEVNKMLNSMIAKLRVRK
jgi:four helix bundle protein